MPTTEEGPIMVTAKDIHGGRIDYSTARHTSWDAYRNAVTDKSRPRVGDVLLTKDGSIGRVAICDRTGVCINQSVALIQPNKSIDSRFLKYLLEVPHYQNRMESDSDGTTIKHIYITRVDKMQVAVPPLSEQRAIVHILGTLDDKIELNRRMSETLEAMARGLFESWFVKFDPVRAKAEGRDPGLPKPLADLFPARLVDSELGEIPEGWGTGTLGDVSTLNPEVWQKRTRPEEITYVDLSNTKWGRIEAVAVHRQADAPSRAQRVLRPGDTIVGTVRPGNGSYAFISEEGLTGSTGFAVLRPNRAQYVEFIYLAATARENIAALSHLSDGGAYPAVRPEVVAATRVMRPTDRVLDRFSQVTGPLLEKMSQNERQSRILASLRDELLPKLISGELRVKDGCNELARAKA
jgi:type I restriction enzyme S subunit